MHYPAPSQSVAPVAVGPVVKTLHIGHDQAIDLGYAVLVASASEPDSWYEVREQSCGCKSFAYRGHCRHLGVAIQAQMMGVETATPIETSPGLYYDAEGHTFTAAEIEAQQDAARAKVQAIFDANADDDSTYYSVEAIRARRGHTVKVLDTQPVGQHPSQTERWL